jgi:hypothetical protein
MLIFVDCEARGPSPISGTLTEFGCVAYPGLETFHGRLYESSPDPACPAVPLVGRRIATDADVAYALLGWLDQVAGKERVVFISDNPAYDWQWIAAMFDRAGVTNPFGHSGRRIGDYYAGLKREWKNTQGWKKLRQTNHDHHPVNDALGNAEAWAVLMEMSSRG